MAVVQVRGDEGIYKNGKGRATLKDIWKKKLTGVKWFLGLMPFRDNGSSFIITMKRSQLTYAVIVYPD